MRIVALALALLGFSVVAHAGDSVDVCYNYGCKSHAVATLGDADLAGLGKLFAGVRSAVEERDAIALAVGELSHLAGLQTPIHNDRGGNLGPEEGVDGRMDCIDHSTTTTGYLQLMQRHGWLHFHQVGSWVARAPWLFNYHRSAQVIESDNGAAYAVDSWFFDNGQPAVIFPMKQWLAGAEPSDLRPVRLADASGTAGATRSDAAAAPVKLPASTRLTEPLTVPIFERDPD